MSSSFSSFFGSFKFKLGISAMALPVAYMVWKHIDWKTKPDSRKRMMIHHAVFWPIAALGLRFMHKSFKAFGDGKQNGKMIAGVLGSSGLITAGFEGGDRLAQALFPKKPAPSPAGMLNPFGSSPFSSGQNPFPPFYPAYAAQNRWNTGSRVPVMPNPMIYSTLGKPGG